MKKFTEPTIIIDKFDENVSMGISYPPPKWTELPEENKKTFDTNQGTKIEKYTYFD